MNEEQTKRDYIDPKLKEAGWEASDVKVWMEHSITDGRIRVSGKRVRPKKADYVLEYKNKKLAVIEAKKLELGVTEGLEQAKEYGKMLDVDFVYSTNGKEIYEYSLKTATGKEIDNFPTPEELWQKTFSQHNKWKEKFVETPFAVSGYKSPRYYQENAISRVLDAVAEDKKRILLTLATGTGKTYIAAQISYKLYESAWSLDKDDGRRPRILFLADRNNLADQAMADFDIFDKDQMARITPAEIRASGNELPHNASVFFTIFQTLVGENGDQRHFEKYDKDFFDFIIIDECHRGGANDESSWREIMEYFAPAVQLGLTATPKRRDNVDTYGYFGEPVYQYSLKQGVTDGYLTPFKVLKFETSLSEFVYTPDEDRVVEGEVIEGKIYEESDFNKIIQIKEREIQRVELMMDNINQNEKTIVFCANQEHAAYIRDLINNYADSNNPDYCVRVTANDGKRGEDFLRQFRNNEEEIPTILTTSQKLSTGVDAMNLRNVVLFRPVNSMIEFKQIVGRGTRVFENKYYFTILDFVEAYKHFADPEWDGEPIPHICKKM
jgi:type I restriction enzyme R subunit